MTASASEDTAVKGILILIIGVAVFSVQDLLMKLFSEEQALHQVIFARGVVMLVLLSAIMYHKGGLAAFKTQNLTLCLVRGAAAFICFTAFSMALATLPLADTMTLYYTSPFFVLALSIPVLGERIGWRSTAALMVGFIGVVVVAQPETGRLEPAMLLAVFSALSYALQCVLSRKLGPTDTALGMTFYSQVVFVVGSGAAGVLFGSGGLDTIDHPSAQYLFRPWAMPTLDECLMFLGLGAVGLVASYCISEAYRLGPANSIAPFEYTSLPLAVLWGWLFWGDLPTITTLFGSLLIVGSGLYVLHREVMRKGNKPKRFFLRRRT